MYEVERTSQHVEDSPIIGDRTIGCCNILSAIKMKSLAAWIVLIVAGIAIVSAASAGIITKKSSDPDKCIPTIIAHRGASGYIPEHTLGSYALAITIGADYVEPDLVMTKDGALIARHDNELGLTTDVAKNPKFANRHRNQTVDGIEVSGWFTEDFTLAEIKTLKAIERIPDIRPGNARMDGIFEVPTFQEIIDLVKSLEVSQQRTIGIYPEIKHGSHFKNLGLNMEQLVVDTFHSNGYTSQESPAYIQSFEVSNLKELKNMTNLRLLQLYESDKNTQPADQAIIGTDLTYGKMSTPEGLAEVAKYAYAVGPDKSYIIPRKEDNTLGEPTTFVNDAHKVGLKVHPYTFRAENTFLPTEFKSSDPSPSARGNLAGELSAYLAAGIDAMGIFSVASVYFIVLCTGVLADNARSRRPGPDDCEPVVVAHRGSSGYVSEHTLGSYALAVTQGADYVEPDLVMTKDGHLIARHENQLQKSTDVAHRPEFADRYRTETILGYNISLGWLSEDFTLAEIKTLKAIEPIPQIRPGNTRMDGSMDIPTFQEIIDLVKGLETSLNRTIGIYPELKHGAFFQSIGLPMEQTAVDIFHRNGYIGPDAPVYIQSFEANSLKILKNITDLRLLQLIGRISDTNNYARMITPEGLREIATYASAVGPDKSHIIPRDYRNRLGAPTSFVNDAHAVGLKVHPYTFRAENAYLPVEFRSSHTADSALGDLYGELEAYLATGIDGLFIDQPDYLVRLRKPCL